MNEPYNGKLYLTRGLTGLKINNIIKGVEMDNAYYV